WPSGLDGERFQALAARHGLLVPPDTASDPAPPPELLAAWRREYRQQTARSLLALGQLRELAEAFSRREVPVIALKGAAALGRLYEDPAFRPMQDLDLLVHEAD